MEQLKTFENDSQLLDMAIRMLHIYIEENNKNDKPYNELIRFAVHNLNIYLKLKEDDNKGNNTRNALDNKERKEQVQEDKR